LTSDIAACGPAILNILTTASSFLSNLVAPRSTTTPGRSDHPYSIADHRTALSTAWHLANDQINAIPFHLVENRWLRLYTDVSIMHSALDLATTSSGTFPAQTFWLNAIRRLDMAIIVAGALGHDRAEWIQLLIGEIQRKGLPRRRSPRHHRSPDRHVKKRKSVSQPSDINDELKFAPSPIVNLASTLSVSDYLRDHRDRPFILRQYLHSSDSPCPPWPAIERWRSPDYLLDLVGEGRVVPVEVGSAYDDVGWGQGIIPFRNFLARAGYDLTPENEEPPGTELSPLYLAQHPLLSQFPGLERDISLPDFVWSNPPPTDAIPSYRPPETKDGIVINVWVGSGRKEIVSPAHTVSLQEMALAL